MVTLNLMQQRERWYNLRIVKFELVKFLRERELAFLLLQGNGVRMIKAYSVDYLEKNMKAFRFMKREMNMYYSLAHFENLPTLSFSPKERSKQSSKLTADIIDEYNSKNYYHLKGLDFAVDIDFKEERGEVFDDAYYVSEKIKELFDDYKLPYVLKFSGTQGFHFTIDDRYFLPKHDIITKYETGRILLDKLIKKFNKYKALIDEAGTSSHRRVWKLPLSFDLNSGLIALPLTDEQFENFSREMVTPQEVFKIRLMNRGWLERQHDLGEMEKINNVNNFIDDMKNGK